ncbi:uncharacterized protein LOC142024234 isoform X1 [Carettochelys insculpta]|uniref:uncharacterized protein LOC142024234 isoform X1 n=1 Tax=Carettochelys insculpta TaxID=44489 RepID=UPI003EC0332F
MKEISWHLFPLWPSRDFFGLCLHCVRLGVGPPQESEVISSPDDVSVTGQGTIRLAGSGAPGGHPSPPQMRTPRTPRNLPPAPALLGSMEPTKLLWLVVLGCSGMTRAEAVVQEETLSYPCEASAPSHRIDLPQGSWEEDSSMQWMHRNESIATYPFTGYHPSVLAVGEWGIDLRSCLDLTLIVFDAAGKERRLHYMAHVSPGSFLDASEGQGQRSEPSGPWRSHAANSGGFGAGLLLSLLACYLLS